MKTQSLAVTVTGSSQPMRFKKADFLSSTKELRTNSSTKRRAIFALTALISGAMTVPARANDSAFEGVAGSARLVKGEHTAIRMVRETVVLTAEKETFSTRADFVFKNETPRRVAVTMGFPESSYGDVSDYEMRTKSRFLRFATFVDGVRVSAKRTPTGPSAENNFDAYWLKTVMFAPYQRRRVRVETRAPYGGSVDWGTSRALQYSFTGGNWRGQVAQSDLEVRTAQPGLWTALMMDASKPLDFALETKPGLAILRKTWRNWEAESTVTVGLQRAVPSWLIDADLTRNGNSAGQSIRHAKTFRLGGSPGDLSQFDGPMPQGFVKNGVTYVSATHLQRKLSDWNFERPENARLTVGAQWTATENRWRLTAGPTLVSLAAGNPTLTKVRGGRAQTLRIPAPMKLGSGSGATLYVPLASVANALGLRASANASKRVFTLEKGAWPAA